MSSGKKVSCVLCHRPAETPKTGPLSTKNLVTAHQNCLLYSSGIYCQFSPQFDDLFGFSITDVMDEVKRGSKLYCYRCKRKGATAGCEVKRCKKSYHYPCAVEDGAGIVEDEDDGKYELYCRKHKRQTEEDVGSASGSVSSAREPETSDKSCEAGPSEVKCAMDEGNTSFQILPRDKSRLPKHKPSSRTGSASNRDQVAGPSSHNRDSNTSGRKKSASVKRQLSYNGKQEWTPSKQKCESWMKRLDDPNSAETGESADIASVSPPPLEIDEAANYDPERQLISDYVEFPTESTSGNGLVDENRDDDKDGDQHSGAESVSLLHQRMREDHPISQTSQSPEQQPGKCPVSLHRVEVHAAGPFVPQQSSSEPASYPDYCEPLDFPSSPPSSPAISPHIPEKACTPQHSAPPSPGSPPSDLEDNLDSATFWKVCNEARCTQGIFSDFISEMTGVSHRIQSDEASQEDYDLALKVMVASGKLAALVSKQQRVLEQKEAELRNAAAAMKKIVSALRK